MACVDRVAKNGDNKAQGYRYAMAADVYDAVRSELAQRFVMLMPTVEKSDFFDAPTKAGGVMRFCTLHVRFTLLDAESGETQTGVIVGQGSDSGDKGVYKAMTGATKAFLVNTFLIPTGDDPENEKLVKPTPPPPAGAEALAKRMTGAPSSGGTTQRAPNGNGHGAVFPNYGNAKGQPVHGAAQRDLDFYANGARRTLADPSKERFHDAERRLLAAIEAEQARQNGATDSNEPPPIGEEYAPPF